MSDDACICKGNWRQIVSEVEHLIGEKFFDAKGRRYTFFGVVHGSDDYYYGMAACGGGINLLSCVCNLETHGFKPLL